MPQFMKTSFQQKDSKRELRGWLGCA